MEILDIDVFKKGANCAITPPPSKSVSNRALMLCALSKKDLVLKNILKSRDTAIFIDCLKNLGFKICEENNEVKISQETIPSSAKLFVGNAGTAARFITAFCALHPNSTFEFDSDKEMYKRPMGGLIRALISQGIKFEFLKEEFCFPFKMHTCELKGGLIKVDAKESSQILSGLLMILPYIKNPAQIELQDSLVSKPFIDMTLSMMNEFGHDIVKDKNIFSLKSASKEILFDEYTIEPDATAASYIIALGAIHAGAVLVKNFKKAILQGDSKFVDFLSGKNLIKYAFVDDDLLVTRGDFEKRSLHFDFNDISDTFLTLAAITPKLECEVFIEGIAHTRKQECDRVSAVASELKKLCAKVFEEEDSIRIIPFKEFSFKKKIEIQTYKDHRLAMSFAILGTCNLNNGAPWLSIIDPKCCAKTWSDFFETLNSARMNSENFKVVAIDGGAAVGKSSVSKASASALGFMHVDTGSHYRSLAYALIKNNLGQAGEIEVKNFLATINIDATLIGNQARMRINSELIEDDLIRTEEVNSKVSVFAAMPCVREFLKNYQRSMREFAMQNNFAGTIIEGRDIGSIIFPDANVRIFLDADAQTREMRRSKQGISDSIAKRDNLDLTRKVAPLVCPEGAVLIDTSHLTIEEVINKTIALIVEAK